MVGFACSSDHACADSHEANPQNEPARRALEDEAAFGAVVDHPYRDVCSRAHGPDVVHCLAKVRTDDGGNALLLAAPAGFGPAELRSAYDVPPGASVAGATVAIIDAFDDPNAESDLAVYRSTYGLPPCTTANGCFRKVNQAGAASPLPEPNGSWASEVAIDTDMVSAICPSCKILLVEATDATFADLGTAVNTAVRLGADVVSNSYGALETSNATSYDAKYFTHPGVAIFAASGDKGYATGASYPASGANVIGVGGTTLVRSSNARGWAETVWGSSGAGAAGTGSACSNYAPRPAWVTGADSPNCPRKTVSDVSAVADPRTGVAVYDTYGGSGWTTFGGTSLGSPIVAAIFALAGRGDSNGSFIWSHRTAFRDVTSGTNANGQPASGPACSAGTNNLCNGVLGFDAPTGWGTPIASALLSLGSDAGAPVDAGAPIDAGAAPDASGDPTGGVRPARDAGHGAERDAGAELLDAGIGGDKPQTNPGESDTTANGGGSCAMSSAAPSRAGAALTLGMLAALVILRPLRRCRRPDRAKVR
ncbi:hypothetical protein [Pendulispora albinea]|uniref:Peptidase S53 domain-containing protein n=1 Tax=Pendulispora albinea TaxID=2741071 RepID=A0ABZ2LJE5_9BACT